MQLDSIRKEHPENEDNVCQSHAEEFEITALAREFEKLRQEKWDSRNIVFIFWTRIVASIIIPIAVGVWIFFVFAFVKDCSLIEGGKYMTDDKVLIALVGGTSASILTVLVLIIKYLFPLNRK